MPDDFFRRHTAADIFADRNPELPLEIDLGCGDGTFLIEMAKHSAQTHGQRPVITDAVLGSQISFGASTKFSPQMDNSSSKQTTLDTMSGSVMR